MDETRYDVDHCQRLMDKLSKDVENTDKRTLTELYGSSENQTEIMKGIKSSKHNGVLTYLFNELNALKDQFVDRVGEIDSKVAGVQVELK